MSLPRPVPRGRTAMITRRCVNRQMLLRPSHDTNRCFLYCLGAALRNRSIELHWTELMSNHHHTGLTDPEGELPLFLADLHRNVARAMNCLLGRSESLWANEQTSVVELVDPSDAFDKMIYSLTNPVKDHLVDKACNWPGASSLDAQLHGKTLTIHRPYWFFDKQGSMPATVELTFTRPPGFEHLTEEQWVAHIKHAIAKVEQGAAERRKAMGKRIVGRKRILKQSPTAHPKRPARRGTLNPRLAAKNKWRRIETIKRNKRWLRNYAAALKRYKTGDRDAVFPHANWHMSRNHHSPMDVTDYLVARAAALAA